MGDIETFLAAAAAAAPPPLAFGTELTSGVEPRLATLLCGTPAGDSVILDAFGLTAELLTAVEDCVRLACPLAIAARDGSGVGIFLLLDLRARKFEMAPPSFVVEGRRTMGGGTEEDVSDSAPLVAPAEE